MLSAIQSIVQQYETVTYLLMRGASGRERCLLSLWSLLMTLRKDIPELMGSM